MSVFICKSDRVSICVSLAPVKLPSHCVRCPLKQQKELRTFLHCKLNILFVYKVSESVNLRAGASVFVFSTVCWSFLLFASVHLSPVFLLSCCRLAQKGSQPVGQTVQFTTLDICCSALLTFASVCLIFQLKQNICQCRHLFLPTIQREQKTVISFHIEGIRRSVGILNMLVQ